MNSLDISMRNNSSRVFFLVKYFWIYYCIEMRTYFVFRYCINIELCGKYYNTLIWWFRNNIPIQVLLKLLQCVREHDNFHVGMCYACSPRSDFSTMKAAGYGFILWSCPAECSKCKCTQNKVQMKVKLISLSSSLLTEIFFFLADVLF